jgi:ActR/RegA family two-component response regulator
MIYFVDEDLAYAKEFTVPLILRGYEVKVLENADQALNTLEQAQDVQLVIVDVMLATGEIGVSQFTADDTEGFLKTGLTLIEYLTERRGDIFPRKFVVLTAASESSLISTIERMCRKSGITVLWKSDYRRPADLADKLVELIRVG